MSTPFHSSPKSCTAQDANEWLLATQQKNAELYSKAAGLWQSDQHLAAFAEMSALLQEAFEEVRVISGQLRTESQAARAKATDLQTHSAQIIARGRQVAEQMSWFAPPPAEEVQKAESQMLEIFKHGLRHGSRSKGMEGKD
jgi:hypothetical protein